MRRLLAIISVLTLALSSLAAEWGIVSVTIGCMRAKPGHVYEQVSQVVMGTPVKIDDHHDIWYHITSPEGYQGWLNRASVAIKTADEMAQWRRTPRLICDAPVQVTVWADSVTETPRGAVSDLVRGCIVEGELSTAVNGRVPVTLPDGRSGWVDSSAMISLTDWASRSYDAELILDAAHSLMGAPYLWGGATPKATDCSGLVKVSYYADGYILKRDASQQIHTGGAIAIDHATSDDAHISRLRPGDLLFFSSDTGTRVSHVGLYDGDGWYIHCSGRVKRNHLKPDHQAFDKTHRLLAACRIQGYEGTDGISRVADHKWYFD